MADECRGRALGSPAKLVLEVRLRSMDDSLAVLMEPWEGLGGYGDACVGLSEPGARTLACTRCVCWIHKQQSGGLGLALRLTSACVCAERSGFSDLGASWGRAAKNV